MLETSKDLFWIVLTFVILWIGIFMGWGVFYIALILKDLRGVTKSIRKKMNMLDQILEMIKSKVESTASYLPPLIEAGGKIMEHFKEKKKTAKSKK
ncbi:MAG TPA: hypothetical protein VJB67_01390 [Patescibacteria group bacterium]|nr:hypothetical protein [Patescibacteria group bacterium]